MRNVTWFAVLLAALGGCGGQYILTAPDQVGPAGGQGAVVVRVERYEVSKLAVPVKNAPIQFRTSDDSPRVAYTDSLGYAATTVAVPQQAGRHAIEITYQDPWGDIVAGNCALYAWDADKPAIAVDVDCLPVAGAAEEKAARSALAAAARKCNVAYMTQRPAAALADVHRGLAAAGYPDGPVLLWQGQSWHVRRVGALKLPGVVVEPRLVSGLAALRQEFPRLKYGLCASPVAAKAFSEAGLECLMIGPGQAAPPEAKRLRSWDDLARMGL